MNNKKPHLLIAGGTGFIGSFLAKEAIKRSWNVTSLSLTKPKKNRKVNNVKYLIGDITKKKIFGNIGDDYNYVVNSSGYTSNLYKKKFKNKIYRSHVIGSLNLINHFLDKEIDNYIQIGSSAEYGNAPHLQKESYACKPSNIYGLAKLKATKYLLKVSKNKNFRGNVLRFFQVYGPKQGKNRAIPQILYNCYKNKYFPASDGKQIRDFCYIDDVVDAIFKTLIQKKHKGHIINIGNGKGTSFKTLITLTLNIAKGGKPQFGKFNLRNHENPILVPNIDKAKKLLKWKPTTTLIKGLQETLRHLRKHER